MANLLACCKMATITVVKRIYSVGSRKESLLSTLL
jgi:hypothetical protein